MQTVSVAGVSESAGDSGPSRRRASRGGQARKTVITYSLMLLVLFVWTGPSMAVEDMGLITSDEKGTYYQFGLDLQKLVKPASINLSVYTSKGSIENVYAGYQQPRVPLGIMKSD